MKEKKLYTCELCYTDYASKEMAVRCEESHKRLEKAEITAKYLPFTQDEKGLPRKIVLKFPNDYKEYIYKR